MSQYVTVGFVGTQSNLFVESGVPLLRGQNIRPQGLDLSNLKYISSEVHAKWRKSALQPGDIVVVRVGYPGTACVIPEGIGDLNAASLLIVRPKRDECEPYFLASVLNSNWGKATIAGLLVGSAQQVLNTRTLSAMRVPLPPYPTQRGIAAVLSAYDELIENNTRRIQILEEMAQAIYREWFVELRYPGREGAPLVDSEIGPIPEGWTLGRLGDSVTLEYGKALKNEDRDVGPAVVMGSSGPVGYHSQALVSAPGIVVGRKGNAGAVHWVDAPFFPIDTTFYVLSDLDLLFVYYQLRLIRFVTSDTAVPGLSRRQAYLEPFLRPQRRVVAKFSKTVSPIRELISVLTLTNGQLRATRDLLLPRLITGEIDVSDLDIDTSSLVA